jgi:lambda family phage portal protein
MIKKLLGAFKRSAPDAVPNTATKTRNFHAAQMTNLTAGWTTVSRSMDSDLRTDLSSLRARSRVLAKDNDYLRNFLAMVCANVIGHNGFTLQMRVKDPSGKADALANKAIEAAYYKWSKRKYCDLAGKLSFPAMQRLAARTVARDGECLIRKVRDKKLNAFGFSLQLVAIDRLELQMNQDWNNGNIIRMGIEINKFGRPVAYHLRTDHPGDGVYRSMAGQRYERVPAADMVHLFVQEDPEQTRGYPWAVSAMTRLNHLGAFDEAAVIAARIGASKMGWFKNSEPDPMGGVPGAETADTGTFTQEASPGEFGVLPNNYDFVAFNPDYPHANYGPFTKSCLRGIAAGLGVNYNNLANDLESVNYSSLRAGTLSERDQWMTLQNWFSDVLMESVFEDWLRMSLLMGAIGMPNGSLLPATKYEKFNAAEFQGRRWPWVDPLKDVQASVLAINNLLSTRTKVLAEQGGDFNDTAQEWSDEAALLEGLGISLAMKPGTGKNSTAVEENPPPDEKSDE